VGRVGRRLSRMSSSESPADTQPVWTPLHRVTAKLTQAHVLVPLQSQLQSWLLHPANPSHPPHTHLKQLQLTPHKPRHLLPQVLTKSHEPGMVTLASIETRALALAMRSTSRLMSARSLSNRRAVKWIGWTQR